MLEKPFALKVDELNKLVYNDVLPVIFSAAEFVGMEKMPPYLFYFPRTRFKLMEETILNDLVRRLILACPGPAGNGCYIIWTTQIDQVVAETIRDIPGVSTDQVLTSMATKAVWLRIQSERKQLWFDQMDVLDALLSAEDFERNLPFGHPIPREALAESYAGEKEKCFRLPSQSANTRVHAEWAFSNAECNFASFLARKCSSPEQIGLFFRGCRKTGLEKMNTHP
ncbi:MAG: hypothetical protein M3Q73_01835 [bacterium]|nr:hypothetical protein [bacterium]